jgi:hypothetical protein
VAIPDGSWSLRGLSRGPGPRVIPYFLAAAVPGCLPSHNKITGLAIYTVE